jgi:hypothetical protein
VRRARRAAGSPPDRAEIYEPLAPGLSWRERLRTIVLCLAVEFAVLSGVPMRPEEIRELMQTMNAPKVVHVLPEEDESGDGNGPPPDDR